MDTENAHIRVYGPRRGQGTASPWSAQCPRRASHPYLKQTGSYEQASYAIQDTPEMVANPYGRFLPQDKASLAAQVLNKVWL